MLLRLVNVISSNVIDSTVRLVKGIFRIRDIGQLFKGYWDIGGFFIIIILGYGMFEFFGGYDIFEKKNK